MEGVYLYIYNLHTKIFKLLMVADAQTSRDADNMSILCVFPFDKPFFEQSVYYMSFHAHCTYHHDAPAKFSSGYEGREGRGQVQLPS